MTYTAPIESFSGINAQYGIAVEESGVKFPSLQATTYQPGILKKSMIERMEPTEYMEIDGTYFDRPYLGLSEDSLGMLDPEQAAMLQTSPMSCIFDDQGTETVIHVLPPEVRFAIVAKPRLYKLNKDTGEVSYLVRGEKMAGTKNVTVSRLFLAVIVGDFPLLDADGKAQIFTLKLTSSKTALIGRNDEPRTISALNNALQKHYKSKGQWLTHLVSVPLAAVPQKFTSKTTGESSTGIMFEMTSGAKPLPDAAQKVIFDTVSNPDFQEIVNDPFGLKTKVAVESETQSAAESEAKPVVDMDAIPF